MGSGLRTDRLISLLSPMVFLLLWEISGRAGFINPQFFPMPSSIFDRFVVLVANGELLKHVSVSLQRLFWGFVVGALPAIVFGIAMGLSTIVRAMMAPLVAATYPLPKSAILPLILLIFGYGEASKIVMVAMGVFYPILINTASGVRQIPSIYLDVGTNFNASRTMVFFSIALPGALPSILAGVQLGVGMGLILITIAEMIGANSGIGFMIWRAWQTLSVETMYVGLLTIAVLGYVLTTALVEMERWLIPGRRPA